LANFVTAYLDTNVAVWLAQPDLNRISSPAKNFIQTADLLISPIVLMELEYLYEIDRILISARDLQIKLEHELGVRVCKHDFEAIANRALNEKWTRDCFDRIVVAHAKTNGFSYLISSDTKIQEHYPRTIW
jgi:PIN domain nuclease of toxin-antitoxin system